MDNITKGHWIFAGIFAVVFVVALVWSYSKDSNITKVHYKKATLFILSILVVLFLLFVFRQYFH